MRPQGRRVRHPIGDKVAVLPSISSRTQHPIERNLKVLLKLANARADRTFTSHERANSPRGEGAKPRASEPPAAARADRELRGSRAAEWRASSNGQTSREAGAQSHGSAERPPRRETAWRSGQRRKPSYRMGARRNMSTTIRKRSLMRCMWLMESQVTDEATGVAEYRAWSLRCRCWRAG